MEVCRVVNSVFSSNTYLLMENDEAGAVLVDIGDLEPVIKILHKQNKCLKAVFLTHTHYDHIYGIRKLIRTYPDCLIYTSEFGKEALASDRLNFSRYHSDPINWASDNVRVLHEGDAINIFHRTCIDVFETPGHDKSCLTFRVGRNLFTGDSFIPGVKIVASFPNSNKLDAEQSRLRILSMLKDCNLYPGHGNAYMKFRPEVL